MESLRFHDRHSCLRSSTSIGRLHSRTVLPSTALYTLRCLGMGGAAFPATFMILVFLVIRVALAVLL